MHENNSEALQRLIDRTEIYDVVCRYARGVDRGDWDLLRSTYHPDAYDDHVEYKGNIDGLIEWLKKRFANADNSMHFLGNCLIEFAGPDLALVETYYASRRLRAPVGDECANLAPSDAICRQSWGRYLDRFERRQGQWRVAHRIVVIDSRFTSVAKAGARNSPSTWGTRDRSDPFYAARAKVLDDASSCPK
jgi:hypothetical protein